MDTEALKRETTTLALQQAIVSGRWAIPAGLVILALLAPQVGWGRAAVCGLVLAACLSARNLVLQRTLSGMQLAQQGVRALLVTTSVLGLLLGAFPALVFPELTYATQLLLTMVLCMWATAAVLSSGLSASVYGGYLAAVVGGLAFAWWLHAEPTVGHLMAAAVVLYGATLFGFSVHFSRRIEESIAIRAQNAQLVRQLAAANDAKTRFLMAASHDLRQPLHALGLMSAGLLRMNDPQEIRQLSQTLAGSVQNLNQLFSSILDISRLDSGDLRINLGTFSLDRLVAQLDTEYRALCLAEDRRWECQLEPMSVRSDPVQTERLLRNLLDNALKHGGRGAVRLSVAREGEHAVVTVADTGPGIRPEERERVFDEFYRNGSSGLGLGLSIVKRLADKLGAGLALDWTDPVQALGARFTLRLPLAPAGAEPEVMDEPEVDLAGLAVLVLDDDPNILQATRTLLRSWGCRVATCAGSHELDSAMERLGEADVALVDYQLDGGEVGPDVIAKAQQAWPGMSTLIVTGESDPQRLAQLRDLGFVLTKPLAPETLRRALASVRSAGD